MLICRHMSSYSRWKVDEVLRAIVNSILEEEVILDAIWSTRHIKKFVCAIKAHSCDRVSKFHCLGFAKLSYEDIGVWDRADEMTSRAKVHCDILNGPTSPLFRLERIMKCKLTAHDVEPWGGELESGQEVVLEAVGHDKLCSERHWTLCA